MEKSFKIKRLSGLLIVLLYLQPHYGSSQAQDFDCVRDCFGEFMNIGDEPTAQNCQVIDSALTCYDDNVDLCWSFSIIFHYREPAMEKFDELGCSENSQTTTPADDINHGTPAPPPPSVICPSVPGILVSGSSEADGMQNFASPNIFPNVEPPGCTMYNPDDLQHCSMFAFSHLRAFGGYRGGLETCSIPGAWDLFRHSAFSVQVNGELEDVNSNHTKLTQINVTFYQTDCLEETKSYVADHRYPLPSSFTDQSTPHPRNSSLVLDTDESGTLTTILAIWINATIVIRRHAGLLSITFQVPGRTSFESDGLCTGCPAHSYVNITQYELSIQDACVAERSSVNTNCFLRAGVANQNAFSSIGNNTYLESCLYSLYKGGDVGVLQMYNRVANDAKLLPTLGYVPPRPQPPGPQPPGPPTPSPPVDNPNPPIVTPTSSGLREITSSPVDVTLSETTLDAFSSARAQTFLTRFSNFVTIVLLVGFSLFFAR